MDLGFWIFAGSILLLFGFLFLYAFLEHRRMVRKKEWKVWLKSCADPFCHNCDGDGFIYKYWYGPVLERCSCTKYLNRPRSWYHFWIWEDGKSVDSGEWFQEHEPDRLSDVIGDYIDEQWEGDREPGTIKTFHVSRFCVEPPQATAEIQFETKVESCITQRDDLEIWY